MSISRRRSEDGKNNENSYPAAPLRRRVSFSLPAARAVRHVRRAVAPSLTLPRIAGEGIIMGSKFVVRDNLFLLLLRVLCASLRVSARYFFSSLARCARYLRLFAASQGNQIKAAEQRY